MSAKATGPKLNLSSLYEQYISYFSPQSFEDRVETEESRRIQFFLSFIPFGIFMCVLNLLLQFSYSTPYISTPVILLIIAMLVFVPFFLKLSRDILVTSFSFTIFLYACVFVILYANPSLTARAHYYFPLLMLFGIFSSGRKIGVLYFVLSLLLGFAYSEVVKFHYFSTDPVFLSKYISGIYIDYNIVCIGVFFLSMLADYLIHYEYLKIKNIQRQNVESKVHLNTQARYSNLEEVAGGIAHEINNPLFAISGSVEQVLRDPKLSQLHPRSQEKLRKIKNQTERIHRLIDSLILFGGDASNLGEEALVTDAIRESIRLHKMGLEKEQVQISVAGENFPVKIDLFSLMRVINNLILNAREALLHQPEKWIRIQSVKEKDQGYIDVIDSGTGIDNHIIEKIFQPFFTTKDIGDGAGLGLSEAKGILKTFQSEISYELYQGNTCWCDQF